VTEDDVLVFFEHQLDPDASAMAAFPSRDREAHLAHWRKIAGDPTALARTVVVDGRVAGNIGSWEQDGERDVGYWIGREFWGRGVATAALAQLLVILRARPLYAHVARHNAGSIRVLEKCGFHVVADDDPVELVMRLDAPAP
jgi:RimJ/RimL family protein N-acetyltransferase